MRPTLNAIGVVWIALAACGTDPAPAAPVPTGCITPTVQVSPATRTLAIGDTLRLVATVGPAACAQETPAWTSSDTTRVTVASDGRATAVRSGGPVQVSATVRGVSAAAAITVAPPANEDRWAFAMVDGATGKLDPLHTGNATGGDVRVRRTALGRWVVTFGRVGRALGQADAAFVTPRDGSYCTLVEWGPRDGDLDVSVRCIAIPGLLPVNDAQFSVVVVGNLAFQSRHAFAFADQSTTASYRAAAATSYSSVGDPIDVTRGRGSSPTGVYNVTTGLFPRSGAFANQPEVMFVSTVDSLQSPAFCAGEGSEPVAPGRTLVACSRGSALADAAFTVMVASGGRPGKQWGFAFFSSSTLTVDPSFSAQSTGQLPEVVSATGGRITLRLAALGALRRRGLVIGRIRAGPVVCGYDTIIPVTGEYTVVCRDPTGVVTSPSFSLLVAE